VVARIVAKRVISVGECCFALQPQQSTERASCEQLPSRSGDTRGLLMGHCLMAGYLYRSLTASFLLFLQLDRHYKRNGRTYIHEREWAHFSNAGRNKSPSQPVHFFSAAQTTSLQAFASKSTFAYTKQLFQWQLLFLPLSPHPNQEHQENIAG